MSLQQRAVDDLGLGDAAFAAAWVLAALLLVPVQLASMILFDEAGLDTLVPDLVFMAVVPAAVVSLLLALVARRLYARRTTYVTAAVAFVAFALLAAFTMGLYAMCGPNC